ncbi:MAG: iron-sulfur cluster assembly accessory protein [Chitinophagales bacterium]|jgi:iron-sulfur cluster assembly protein|nr:iron-sulfur cluster assembly accessory protein [Chitinophagales bacterium]
MIVISAQAKNKIQEILSQKNNPEDFFVRVSVLSGGCSGFKYDIDFDKEQKSDDMLFEDQGIKMLTDPMSFLYISNSSLEFTDGLNGKGFHFVNPNATRTCACGESFAL